MKLRLFDRCRRRWRIIISILTITIFHNEIFVYWRDSTKWPNLNCKKFSGSDCQTLLIVADPQILGPSSEPLGRIGYMDVDPYLRKSFMYALHHVKSDVVIFLGDLMDEGSTSSDEEYSSYKARFDDLFNAQESKVIYLPGDNDIGGEGSDRITEHKVQRFYQHFPSASESVNGNLQFVLVNRLATDLSLPKISNLKDKQTILLSHIPLTFLPGIFTREVLESLRPNAIFSAHDHRLAAASVRFDDPENLKIINDFESGDILRKQLNDEECLEITWPTCSYRMGVKKIGYGSIVINSDGTLEAGILWVHSRFLTLSLYLFGIGLCLGICVFPKC